MQGETSMIRFFLDSVFFIIIINHITFYPLGYCSTHKPKYILNFGNFFFFSQLQNKSRTEPGDEILDDIDGNFQTLNDRVCIHELYLVDGSIFNCL